MSVSSVTVPSVYLIYSTLNIPDTDCVMNPPLIVLSVLATNIFFVINFNKRIANN